MPEDVDTSKWDVLMIDDEPDSLRVVGLVFDFNRVKYRVASSGREGLNLIAQHRPTLILCDIQMPEMSGWEVLKTVRSDAALNDLVVIAITAHALDEARERSIAEGFDGYFSKPISPAKLLRDLISIVQQKGTQNL